MIESVARTGGQATSIAVDEGKHGAHWMNDGVQGGSPIFRHTFHYFKQYGYEARSIKLQVSFGKGREDFWTNVFPSPLVDDLKGEIRKFGRMLKCIKYLMPIFGLMPIKALVRLFRFSDDFSNKMVLAPLALFLGTGNQTPNVPGVLLERIFNDARMKLWEFDPDTMITNRPTMFTFPHLDSFYKDWTSDLISKGLDLRLNCTAKLLDRGKQGVTLRLQKRNERQPIGEPTVEKFDEMVICCPADEAKFLLGDHATWRERFVLGGVTFFHDVTITHTDSEYMAQHFEQQYHPNLAAEATTPERKDQIAFAGQPPRSQMDGWFGFRPMYFIHSIAQDPEKIEMGFDVTNYQHQFRDGLGMDQPSLPQDRHIFQTIFLNAQQQNLWTWHGIDQSKIIARKWWHQFGHRWQHFLRVVPGMIFINGIKRTRYAGAWTMVVSVIPSELGPAKD